MFCRCQVLHRDTPTDYLADLAPCAACEEPAEIDSNGLCPDCASFTPPDSEPAIARAPAPVVEPQPERTAPTVVAETPQQTIDGYQWFGCSSCVTPAWLRRRGKSPAPPRPWTFSAPTWATPTASTLSA